MAISFEWVIPQLGLAPELNGMNNVVTRARWERHAVEDGLSVFSFGVVNLVTSDGNFVSYEDLTPTQVIQWLENNLDVSALDADLTDKLTAAKNPSVIYPPLPWSKNG